MSIFLVLNFFLGGIKMGSWIISADLNDLGRPYRQLGSARELNYNILK